MNQTLVKEAIVDDKILAEQSKSIGNELNVDAKFNQAGNVSVEFSCIITIDDNISPTIVEDQLKKEHQVEEKLKERSKRSKISIAEKIKEIQSNIGEMLEVMPGKINVNVTEIKSKKDRNEKRKQRKLTQQNNEKQAKQIGQESQQTKPNKKNDLQANLNKQQQKPDYLLNKREIEQAQVLKGEKLQHNKIKQEYHINNVTNEYQQQIKPQPDLKQLYQSPFSYQHNISLNQQPQSILLSFHSNIFSININPSNFSPQINLAKSLLSQINFLKLKLNILQIRRSISEISAPSTIAAKQRFAQHKLRHSSNKKHSPYRSNFQYNQSFDQFYCQSIITPSTRTLHFQQIFLQYTNKYFFDFKLGMPRANWSQSQLQKESQSVFLKLGLNLKSQTSQTLIIKRYNNCFTFLLDSNRALFWYFQGRFYYGGWSANTQQLCEKNGWGYDYYPQKYVYSGTYRENKKHGYGIIKYFADQQGVTYEGQWNNGRKEGLGKQREKDGTEYIGQWSRGLQNGKGKIELPKGQIFQVVFVNGKIQSQRRIQVKSQKLINPLENVAKVKFTGRLGQLRQQQANIPNVIFPIRQNSHTKIQPLQ